jgi:hypothetical protein
MAADEPEIIHSSLRTASFTTVVLHIITIFNIVQKELWQYHVSLAIHMIVLTALPFLSAFQYPGWRRLYRWEKIAYWLNSLILVGESGYLYWNRSELVDMEKLCRESNTESIPMIYEYIGLTVIPVFGVAYAFPLILANESISVMAPIFGTLWAMSLSAILQSKIVSQYLEYQKYNTKRDWGFCEIFCMMAIAAPLYDLCVYGSQKSPDRSLPRYHLWRKQCSIFPNAIYFS